MKKSFVDTAVFDHSLGIFVHTHRKTFDETWIAAQFYDELRPTSEEFEPYNVWDGAKHRIRFAYGSILKDECGEYEDFIEASKEFAVERSLKIQEIK